MSDDFEGMLKKMDYMKITFKWFSCLVLACKSFLLRD